MTQGEKGKGFEIESGLLGILIPLNTLASLTKFLNEFGDLVGEEISFLNQNRG